MRLRKFLNKRQVRRAGSVSLQSMLSGIGSLLAVIPVFIWGVISHLEIVKHLESNDTHGPQYVRLKLEKAVSIHMVVCLILAYLCAFLFGFPMMNIALKSLAIATL